jgi:outer membrane protein OmpA-like peptidoglycan-associated protein
MPIKFLTACLLLLSCFAASAQRNLLVNGDFEDVNTCTEYNSECGVEGWFYLKDVKAQMLSNDSSGIFGQNSFGIFYNWNYYKDFTPLIGALLPCGLQKDKRYTFKGMLSARVGIQLELKPGIAVGEKFYVPRRPFVKGILPDSITLIRPVPNSNFFSFEYSFIADGSERYLTFGTYITEDTIAGRKKLTGVQTVSIIADNFELVPEDKTEVVCADFRLNAQKIYAYNSRHKEMDYSLYAKGELAIVFDQKDSSRFITSLDTLPPLPVIIKTDTLQLGDVLFDFNRSELKKRAVTMLNNYFNNKQGNESIDSIVVEGHTDAIGSEASNLQLSLARCGSVKKWLTANAVIVDALIRVKPFGKSRPVASNETAAGRALNRRVELIIFRKQSK